MYKTYEWLEFSEIKWRFGLFGIRFFSKIPEGVISQNTFHSFHKIHKEEMEVLFSTNWFDFHIGDKEHALSVSKEIKLTEKGISTY